MNQVTLPHAGADNPLDYEGLHLNSRHVFAHQVSPLADGSQLSIPTLVLVGSAYRPRLVCVAGVHGNEHEGITALLELWDELQPDSLTGTLVMVPVANPPAFRAGVRRNPEDMVDMNRAFPGTADGTITQKLAYHLFHDIVAGADLLLSMHGWTDDALVIPYAEYPQNSPVTEPSRAAAMAFGLEYVEAFIWPEGLLAVACNRMGIPAIEPEIGGLGCTIPERRALYKRGVRNLLKHLSMVPGDPDLPGTVYHVKRSTLHAPVGGVIWRHVEIGEEVKVGDKIATITDLLGRPAATITTPLDGFVSTQRLRACVNPGELVAVIFQPESH